jgi:ABC-type phosphate transport system substrate-binding protein
MRKLSLFMMLSSILLITICPLPVTSEEPAFTVIVNADNPATTLSAKDISKLFLKKVKLWEQTKEPVLPVDQVETTDIRNDFSQDILGKKQAAIKAYWQKQIFSGRDVPPPEKDSDEAVLEYVDANSGAIGYVSASADLEDYHIKVVEILE